MRANFGERFAIDFALANTFLTECMAWWNVVISLNELSGSLSVFCSNSDLFFDCALLNFDESSKSAMSCHHPKYLRLNHAIGGL